MREKIKKKSTIICIVVVVLLCLLVVSFIKSQTKSIVMSASDSVNSINVSGSSFMMDSSSAKSSSVRTNSYTESVSVVTEGEDVSDESASNAKLIRTVKLSYKTTENNIESVLADLVQRAKELNGYAQNNEITQYNQSVEGELTLRVPNERTDELLDYLSGTGLLLKSKNDTQEDVTLSWSELDTRIRVLESQKEKYLSYIDSADTIDEILKVDAQLQDVLLQLETNESKMKVLNDKIDYATVKITVEYTGKMAETVESREGFFTRLGQQLSSSWDDMQDAFIFLVGILISLVVPCLAIIGLILLVVYVCKLVIYVFKYKFVNKHTSEDNNKQSEKDTSN
jgi:hypothetical protein